MHHLLIISFDQLSRNESNAFALVEYAVQYYKQLYPDITLDYLDLLQEEITPAMAERFQSVYHLFFVVSFIDGDTLPENCLQHLAALAQSRFVVAGVSKRITLLADIKNKATQSVQVALSEYLRENLPMITEPKSLTKQLFSLEEQAQK